jgi:preprotein translocase subunit SecB
MSDNPEPGAQQAAAPRLSIVTQYIKDVSFENPRAPMGLIQSQPRPEIQIGVNAEARQLGEGRYEVVLQLNVEAKATGETVFLLELSYGGVFEVANIPQDSLQPLLLIECPRLIFPFVRRIVADISRDGGFPPLMLDPIDFVALYRQQLQQAQQQAAAQAGDGNGSATV